MNPSNKPPQGDNLSELEVVTSRHPQLTPDHPLEVLWDYYAGPETFYHGDVHYVLQLSIVRHGQIEIAYENHRRTCRSGDLWWTFCWEPHAFRCLDKRNLIMTVNVNLDDLGEIGLLGSSVNWLAPFSATPDKRYCPRTDDERDFIQKWADHMTHVYRRRPSNWLPQCWLDFHRLLLHVINRLPEGINTILGSRGTYLSGGEQQRIAIARAMLKNADVVILDEASAFADPECEAQVQLAFQEMARGRTVIMIAHRLSTIRNADRIYVLKDGQVEEQGKHDELLKKNGLYAAMWAEYQKAVNWKVGETA